MRLFKMLLLLGLSLAQLQAKFINYNPDPNGEPWLASDQPASLPAELQAKFNAIPPLALSAASAAVQLPSVVDNSQKPYFRSIFNQIGGSCYAASTVSYVFGYEINRQRNLSSAVYANRYPYNPVYNFYNMGGIFKSESEENNSGPHLCFEMMKDGVVTSTDWGSDLFVNNKMWMSGYNKYYQAMQNRVKDYYPIVINTPSGLEILKHWLHDHNTGDLTRGGGLAAFTADINATTYTDLPAGTPEAGKPVIDKLGPIHSHAMTFVGYNDEVRFDFNNDGQYTNNLDITGDGLVTMADWEIGALKIANSWGTSWPSFPHLGNGFCYLPYRLLAFGPGISENKVWVMDVDDEYQTTMTVKFKLQHPYRNHFKFTVGSAESEYATVPTKTKTFFAYDKKLSGELPANGFNDEPIEMMLDMSSVVTPNACKYFFDVENTNSNGPYYSEGYITDITCTDYRNGINYEMPFLTNYGGNYISIMSNVPEYYNVVKLSYKNLPAVITSNTSYNGNLFMNQNSTIAAPAVVTLTDNATLSTKNSELTVQNGAYLNLFSKVKLKSLDAVPAKITVYGTLKIQGSETEIKNMNIVVKSGGVLRVENYATLTQYGNITIEPGALVSFGNNVDLKCQSLDLPSYAVVEIGNNSTLNFVETLSCKEGTIFNIGDNSSLNFTKSGLAKVSGTARNPVFFKNLNPAGKWLGLNFDSENGADLAYCNIMGAANALQATYVSICNLSNLNISNCTNGISIANTRNFNLKNSVISGLNGSGFGVKTYYSEGNISKNIVSNWLNGVEIYYGSPLISQNTIENNSNTGLFVNGSGARPNMSVTFASSDYLNNTVRNNNRSQVAFDNEAYALIRNGYNNIYHDNNSTPLIFKGPNYGSVQKVYNAENTYWGSVVSATNFYPNTNWIDYTPYATTPFPHINSGKGNRDESVVEQMLNSAILAELDSNLTTALETYQNLIKDYPDSEESYFALSRLPGLCKKTSLSFSALEEQLTSLQANSTWLNKDFIKSISAKLFFIERIKEKVSVIAADYLANPVDSEDIIHGRILSVLASSNKGNNNNTLELLDKVINGEFAADNSLPQNSGNLLANYPNPFNPTTTINYTLTAQAEVKVAVFNVAGKEVASLVSGVKNAGQHKVEFNGANLASGVYFCKLLVNGQSMAINKMMLLK